MVGVVLLLLLLFTHVFIQVFIFITTLFFQVTMLNIESVALSFFSDSHFQP